MDETKSCRNCVWALIVDEGYSNWTVTGRTFNCTKNLTDPHDLWYITEGREIEAANKCGKFQNGTPVELDVDLEDLSFSRFWNDSLTKEEKLKKIDESYGNGYIEPSVIFDNIYYE